HFERGHCPCGHAASHASPPQEQGCPGPSQPAHPDGSLLPDCRPCAPAGPDPAAPRRVPRYCPRDCSGPASACDHHHARKSPPAPLQPANWSESHSAQSGRNETKNSLPGSPRWHCLFQVWEGSHKRFTKQSEPRALLGSRPAVSRYSRQWYSQTLDRFFQSSVFSIFAQAGPKYQHGIIATAFYPKHLAQMGGNIRFRQALIGTLQILQRSLQIAYTEQIPAYAIQNIRIVWLQLHGAFQQILSLVHTAILIRIGVAQGVIRIGMIRAQLDHTTHQGFKLVMLGALLVQHGQVVFDLGTVGQLTISALQHFQ